MADLVDEDDDVPSEEDYNPSDASSSNAEGDADDGDYDEHCQLIDTYDAEPRAARHLAARDTPAAVPAPPPGCEQQPPEADADAASGARAQRHGRGRRNT